MKKWVIAALALLGGCGIGGSWHDGTQYVPPPGQPLPPNPPGVPEGTPAYLIEPTALGYLGPTNGTYAITTDGFGRWTLGWLGDVQGAPRRFTGDIYCPVGCDLAAVFVNALPNDSINTIANNHVGFDGLTDSQVEQQINITTTAVSGPEQPVTFDLYIDGVPAVNPYVGFWYNGQVATSNEMPFNLVSTNAAFAAQARSAPLYLKPQNQAGKTLTLPAPAPRAEAVRTVSLEGAQ